MRNELTFSIPSPPRGARAQKPQEQDALAAEAVRHPAALGRTQLLRELAFSALVLTSFAKSHESYGHRKWLLGLCVPVCGEGGEYETFGAFAADVRLMWTNALNFNSKLRAMHPANPKYVPRLVCEAAERCCGRAGDERGSWLPCRAAWQPAGATRQPAPRAGKPSRAVDRGACAKRLQLILIFNGGKG